MSIVQPMADRVASVHLWGFYDDDGRPRFPDGAAPSDLSPYSHHQRIADHVAHFGGDVANLRVTRTLDGRLVGTEFDTPPRGNAARIWHRIIQPQSEWPDAAAIRRRAVRTTEVPR